MITIAQITIVVLVIAAVSQAKNIGDVSLQTSRSIEPRRHHYHKIPYGALLLHIAYGTVATLVIIKIILAISFVGMVSALMHMFASIKYLLKINGGKAEPQHIYVPQSYHSHGYDSTEPEEEHGPYQRRWDLDGARFLKETDDAANKIKYNHDIRKRNIQNMLNENDYVLNKRNTRSLDLGDSYNCKKREICKLHANANHNPFGTIQLYFIKKDGLAKYWDHSQRKYEDCDKAFPCDKQTQSTKNDKKNPTEINGKASQVSNAQARQFTDYGSYSTEYETEYEGPPDYQSYESS